MTRRLNKLIKEFTFQEKDRRTVILGTKVRIVPERNLLTLRAGFHGLFPTDSNLYAKTRLTDPRAARAWVGFQVDSYLPDGTSVGFRLSDDGSTQKWWNGSAWAAAGTNDWNTEQEVADNIAEFPATARALQVIVNLKTDDVTVAPEVTRIKVLYDSDIEWDEEYIARSLIPAMREEILPIADYSEKAGVGGLSSIDLSKIETPYAIDSIDSAYVNDDPVTNIAGAYNSSTKVLTLTTPATSGQIVVVRFVFKPEIVIARSQDYIELAKVPAIVIESIEYGESQEILVGEHVINKSSGEGFQLDVGAHYDIDIAVRWVADKQKDADRLAGQVKKFFDERMLKARGQDELYPLCTVSPYNNQVSAGQSELHAGRLRARLYRALFYMQPAKPVHAVKRILVQGDENFQIP